MIFTFGKQRIFAKTYRSYICVMFVYVQNCERVARALTELQTCWCYDTKQWLRCLCWDWCGECVYKTWHWKSIYRYPNVCASKEQRMSPIHVMNAFYLATLSNKKKHEEKNENYPLNHKLFHNVVKSLRKPKQCRWGYLRMIKIERAKTQRHPGKNTLRTH